MTVTRLSLSLPTEDDTARLGAWLAARLGAGDCLALSGPIGAGKSHLARALIRARLGNPSEDVPSPTFTLVQTYAADVDIWHADLYRLTHPDEVLELGLDEAFARAITLVEWPERMGAALPPDAIALALEGEGEGRRARLSVPDRAALVAGLRADWGAA
jgi:tRNA threonylcarbamoyladenosine biosynthesis protein TsaE